MIQPRLKVIAYFRRSETTTARAIGLRDDQVRRRHAMPNALLPTVTLVFLHLGLVVSGAIAVETVFSWPRPPEVGDDLESRLDHQVASW